MNTINPTAIVFIAFATCVGALIGSWLWGLTIGLGVVLVGSLAPNGRGWYGRP
jgi:hypothetical protein